MPDLVGDTGEFPDDSNVRIGLWAMCLIALAFVGDLPPALIVCLGGLV